MSRSQPDRHSLKRALVASVALHCAFVPLLVVSSIDYEFGTPRSGGDANGVSVKVSYVTIVRRAAHRGGSEARPTRVAARSTATIERSLHATPVSGIAHAPPRPGHAASYTAARSPAGSHSTRRLALTLPSAVPEREPERVRIVPRAIQATPPAVAPSASVTAAASPLATPSAAAVAVAPPAAQQAAARGREVPPGGWGQSFDKPLVADENALAQLRAKFRGAHVVAVDVDEAGHATRVTLAGDLPDDVRARLERELLALRYVPAECNGLRCTGTLSMSL